MLWDFGSSTMNVIKRKTNCDNNARLLFYICSKVNLNTFVDKLPFFRNFVKIAYT